MKKCKKVLAMLIVIVLTITIAGDLSIVYAEEAIQEIPQETKEKEKEEDKAEGYETRKPELKMEMNSEEKIPEKKAAQKDAAGIQVDGSFSVEKIKAKSDIGDLAAPTSFDVEMMINDSNNLGVGGIVLEYLCEESGKSFAVSLYEWNWRQEGNIYTFSVDLNEYCSVGAYKLSYITIFDAKYTTEKNYYYDSELNKFIGESPEEGFGYSGEADFKVTSAEKEDHVAPEVVSVKRITEGPIYSDTNIEYEVKVTENGSGIKDINMEFYSTDSNKNMISFSTYSSIIQGDTITLSSPSHSVGNYKINHIEIEDYAGNIARYEIEKNGTDIVGNINGEEKRVSVIDHTISVEFVKNNLPKIKSMRLEGVENPEAMAAGDTFRAIFVLHNNNSESVKLLPERCEIGWDKEYAEDYFNRDYKYGVGRGVVIKPGETYEFCFTIPISEYAVASKRKLAYVDFAGYYANGKPFYMGYWNGGEQLTGVNNGGAEVDAIPYNGEMDYNVITAEQPDTEAPIVESITIVEKTLKAPGPITFKIKTKGEEKAPIIDVGLRFRDIKDENEGICFGAEEFTIEENRARLTYLESEGCYLYKQELRAGVAKGTYALESVEIGDEVFNVNYYNANVPGENLEGNNSESLVPIQFVVSESEFDGDVTWPKLKDAKMITKEAKPSEEVQLKIQAEDESGISNVKVYYENEKNGKLMDASASRIVKEADNWYSCYFSIDSTCTPGNYNLYCMEVTDGSMGAYTNAYDYNELDGTYTFAEVTGDMFASVVEVAESMNITVLSSEASDYVETDITQAVEDVQKVEKGGTIVVAGIDAVQPEILPQEFVEQVKEKKLTLVIRGANKTSEIRVKGDDLENVTDMGLALSVHRNSLVQESLEIPNKENDMYYPVSVVTSDASLPMTLRVKLEGEFISLCGNAGINFSRKEGDNITVLGEDLKPDENGYITMEVSGRDIAALAAENTNLEFLVSAKKIESGEYTRGDINGDGKINIFDLMAALYHVSGRKMLEGTEFLAADINEDEKINIFDLMRILYYTSGRNESL